MNRRFVPLVYFIYSSNMGMMFRCILFT